MRTCPLTEVASRDLEALLAEEAAHWQEELLWDYADVSSAVAGGVDRRSLSGRVLLDAGRPVAYCYSLVDSGRSIVGSLFATARMRGLGLEEQLLDAVLAEAKAQQGNDRVECQTLFSTATGADARFTAAGFVSRPRHYLMRPLDAPVPVPDHCLRLRPVRREDLGLVARIVHQSHSGTLDAALNMTYATPALCRGFVDTLVLRAGCGRFEPEASFLAEAADVPVGVLLASRLSRGNGHVCQVSVLPQSQSRGIGRVLMAAALEAFRRRGLETASLSVTVGNAHAYRLYERLGFRLRRGFAAHAWVRPPGRIELSA